MDPHQITAESLEAMFLKSQLPDGKAKKKKGAIWICFKVNSRNNLAEIAAHTHTLTHKYTQGQLDHDEAAAPSRSCRRVRCLRCVLCPARLLSEQKSRRIHHWRPRRTLRTKPTDVPSGEPKQNQERPESTCNR